jgi:hypothetical protein
LLGNGSVKVSLSLLSNGFVKIQLLLLGKIQYKNVTASTITHATIEELLDMSFYITSVSYEGKYTIESPASHRGGPGSNPGLVMWDFVMDKRGAGAGFLRELRLFPLPIYIPSASPQSSSLSPEG